MKKIYSIITVLFITASVFGQAPKCFKYQAVLRDARGNIRANTSTGIMISILSGSATGNTVYSETHSVKTDGYGLINLEIGNGTATVGTMSAIDWSDGTYFIKTTVDGVDMGTNQLLSVPFAQYANRAANGISPADSAKLAGIAPGAEVNVNADWNAVSGDAQILNKPTITTADGSETKVNSGTNVTVTGKGTTSNPYVINTTTHALGEEYQGGIVFYVYDGGQHGLIAAKEDLLTGLNGDETGFPWFINIEGTAMSGAIGDGLEAGKMNTSLIIATQMSYFMQMFQSNEDFAAKACVAYLATDAHEIAYGNWYLPSKYELNLLYLSMEDIASLNLAKDYYWSSTEYDRDNAWFQNFSDGEQDYYSGDGSKSYKAARVRPIRAF